MSACTGLFSDRVSFEKLSSPGYIQLILCLGLAGRCSVDYILLLLGALDCINYLKHTF